jgi:hypothetical protein
LTCVLTGCPRCASDIVIVVLATAAPARAASDFDANDVKEPLDLRWIGAWFTQDDDLRVTISFYDGFRVAALPTVHTLDLDRRVVRVQLTGFVDGLYVRRHGRIVLLYGDLGSTCGLDFPQGCPSARVIRSSDNVLKVRFPVFRDLADLSYEIRAFTKLRRLDTTLRDTSGIGSSDIPAHWGTREYREYVESSDELHRGEWLWVEERITGLLDSDDGRSLLVEGCARNQSKFYDCFNAVVLLSAPADVILDRVKRRTTNNYGKTLLERAMILDDLARVEPLLREGCTHELDASRPLDEVVADLIAIALHPRTTS